jgi:superfamily II DNA or RNA helicase
MCDLPEERSMQLVVLEGIDPAEVRRSAGPAAYACGLAGAQRRAVLHMEWDDVECALHALVRGSGEAIYETSAYFEPRGSGELAFVFGECTCPVGVACMHVVTVVATASGATGGATATDEPSWERALDALFTAAPPQAQPADNAVPLAIELSLVVAAGGRAGLGAGSSLQARLVRPGRTGWVGGGLSWGRLESYYSLDGCRPAHARLLREMYSLYRTSAAAPGYSAYADKSIDLALFGRRLWPILDEAAEIGLEVVHARKRLGAVAPYGHAELCLDVTAGATPDALDVIPVLRLEGTQAEGRDVVPVLFLGAEGHGVVYVSRHQTRSEPNPTEWRLHLARLTAPAPSGLRRAALQGRPLSVPEGKRSRFVSEYYPRLRRLGSVVSSDGSFTPPEPVPPQLVLRATYDEGHRLDVAWEWAYTVGDGQVRVPLARSEVEHPFRDLEQEKAVLDALDLPPEPGIPLAGGRPGPARLEGLDTMRFSTEALPALAAAPDTVVEVTGEPAAYREVGDSLQVGLSTSESAAGTDWFDLGVRISVEGRQVPFAEVFTALAAGESHLLLADGAYFSLQKPELQALRVLIEEARSLQDAPSGPLRLSRFQAGLWEELAALGVVDRQARAWREQVAGLLSPDALAGTEVPATLTGQLRPYQREGFDWLCFLWRHRLGGVLADDMGLGKTVQALALICHARRVDPAAGPFLIVAPTSVVPNWAAEAARFAPTLRVVMITDTLRRRGQELAEVIAGADVVVTSYTLFRLDVEDYVGAEWSGLILDEAQFAKNHQAKVHQCARRLPAPVKLAITGTPMENNLMELWSLLSITAPGLFPSPTRFRDTYVRPIEKERDAELLARLRRRIRPLVRRRTKEQVAPELPAKQEQVLAVELEPRHRRLYQRHLQRERQKVLGLIDDVDRNRFTILRSITLLRRLSLHPGLVDAEQAHLGSAKIDTLVEQLAEVVDGGHRALVFSQFTGFLAQVRERLDATGTAYCYLDGTSRNRAATVRRFKDGGAPVFLISLKAGGFGLNLTEADYCFLLDPWWNPATEAQAIDRTHRIGQTRNVMVYRLIAKDTIEEKVLALAQRKAELFAGVMDDGNAFGSALDADDIRALVS